MSPFAPREKVAAFAERKATESEVIVSLILTRLADRMHVADVALGGSSRIQRDRLGRFIGPEIARLVAGLDAEIDPRGHAIVDRPGIMSGVLQPRGNGDPGAVARLAKGEGDGTRGQHHVVAGLPGDVEVAGVGAASLFGRGDPHVGLGQVDTDPDFRQIAALWRPAAQAGQLSTTRRNP